MRRKVMAFAELWLPIIGAGICIAWAVGAWYGDNKILAIWLIFGGIICLLLLGTLQWQHIILEGRSGKKVSDVAETQRAFVVYKGIAAHRLINENGQTT